MDSLTPRALDPLQSLRESVEASGLLPSDRIASAFDGANGDMQALERLLTQDGWLTPFQVTELREGRAASLRVGNYEILDRLGAGGMGTVYKARHRRMKRIVALKVLSPKHSSNPIFVKRFQREVETIACLGHPNVVMAYDADEAEIGHFLVMEFVDGVDLAVAVKREGRFVVSRAVECILQAARGLAYAHAQGIVHRDVKPHNLLLDAGGVVKVTDLGLARLNHGAEGAAEGMEVTMAGGVIGTPDYMPPEQAYDATTIDHRADIYSLGCTLYFLLTGRPPFEGTSFMAVLLNHRQGEIPSLTAIRPEVPQRLDDLFRKMLAKEPAARQQRMIDVVDELQSIAQSLGPYDAARVPTEATMEMPPTFVAPAAGSTIATRQISDATMANVAGISPTTVLVVEPSRVQASIIRNLLEERGHVVVATVATGQAALAAVRQFRPHAVVSAMHLSDVDGGELARQIVSEIGHEAPGFLLVTSESDGGASVALGDLSGVRLLHKPFNALEMDEALRSVAAAPSGAGKAAAAPPLDRPAAAKTARRELRVLIVDDSSVARIHVRTVLEGLGFSVFVDAPDGAHAIAIASSGGFDLIVTDYNMPLMDGRALVSYLKQNPATAEIPIIMVTSETDRAALDVVLKLGALAVLDKAFRPTEVGPLLDSLF